eukprot:751010_1
MDTICFQQTVDHHSLRVVVYAYTSKIQNNQRSLSIDQMDINDFDMQAVFYARLIHCNWRRIHMHYIYLSNWYSNNGSRWCCLNQFNECITAVSALSKPFGNPLR